MLLEKPVVELEVDLDVYSNSYRFALFGRRSKSILLDRLGGLCVETITSRLHQADILRLAVGADDQA